MRLVLSAVAVASLCAAPVWAQSDNSKNTETHDTRPEPPMLGKHLAKGQARPGGGGGSVPLLTYHGGDIMAVPTMVHPIFWGTSWTTNLAVDAGKKIAGMTQFYTNVGGTPYLQTNVEYTEGTAPGSMHVLNQVSFDAVSVDNSAAPRSGSQTGPILAEVCKAIANPQADWYYPVYVDTKRGHAGFCAWHSWGSCNGVPITFGFFFNLDGDSGCDPQDSSTTRIQGLEAIANVSGHELSEMVTDPRGEGWWDSTGAENSDKCAWTFGPKVTFGDGSSWKIQGNWSNAAYAAKTGYDSTKGCIQTSVVP
jgi:hypothetical protein